MKKLIAIGLAGLVGCASPGSRAPVVTDNAHLENPERGFPAWVEVPAWMEETSRQEQSDVNGIAPVVSVLCRVCTWSKQISGMPAFSRNGHAILGDGEAGRIMEKLYGSDSSTVLTSPKVVVRLDESASIAGLSSGELMDQQQSGAVFFVRPTTIDDQGVDLHFSFQLAGYASRNKDDFARLEPGRSKLEGRAKLGVGQWYVRAFEGDYPLAAGEEMALFIQIARVDYPEAPVGERVAVLMASPSLVE